ncbi:rhamnulokinase [Haloarcula marismortui]|uniref:Rhamnulokinase n=1 Tax=Haloarcula marismortui ATCC 33800 TaxID=662476 RepID=M0JNG0_9EURY|nr:rhamnulokinase family protein [Haloarcula sinaiiensis]EMA10692.1 rhamnulokinase [Haloarcula sinaiiensis ATCC 33800]QUJ74539.1 rhamnulokinase [Haloarcula sinaiiensis ATCC 33800]
MNHVAIDIGASGGTVFLGEVTQSSFAVREVHRSDNRPVERNGRYVWDVDALVDLINDGLRAADDQADRLDTVGIDTWGLDFGLLADGELLRDPVSYRDPESTATREQVFEAVGKRRLFDATGITNWNTPNTLWQLHTIADREPELLEESDGLLMMPQLLSARIGGQPAGDVTIASTTQMVDPEARTWATDLLDELSVPMDLLPDLSEPGQRLGPVDDTVISGLSSTPEIVMPASHDTAAAVAGLPLAEDAAFLNTGSWFILGVERDEPVRTDAAFEHAVSNELGVDGTVRLLKNINGFFLLEECRKAWRDADDPADYDTLLSAAEKAPARTALVDTDADTFGIDEPMPDQMRAYCRRTDQPMPTGQGGIVRCLLDSLAAKTALELDALAAVVEDPPSRIVLGGGGVRNELFCQLLADATDRPVSTGPVEATAVGNVLTQAVAAGTVPDIETGRQLVESAFETTTYEPQAGGEWDDAKDRLAALTDDSLSGA